jgi:hypothetical protein
MALIPTIALTTAGVDNVGSRIAANGGGDTFQAGSRIVLLVFNSSGGDVNVTVTDAAGCDQGGHHDVTVTVATNKQALIGPFPSKQFANGSGLATVTCDVTTSVNLIMFQLPTF